MKKNKGITLVALVVTIVVLLILAGVSINLVLGNNGIIAKAKDAEKVISLNAQFGEGWLISGEILSFARQGINHVVSLQPFGCIANHIIVKGIEKRIKALYPQMNILSLDFDSSVSDVNIINRLLLFIDNIENQIWEQQKTII